MNFSKNLRILMASREITAAQLSRITKVPKATISGWLAGASPKRIQQVKVVADFLKVSIDELMFASSKFQQQDAGPFTRYSSEINTGIFEVILRPVKKGEEK